MAVRSSLYVAILALLFPSTTALRVPLTTLARKAQASFWHGVTGPSPFALSQVFEPEVFAPPEMSKAVVTLVWDAASESQIDSLVALAVKGALSPEINGLTVVTRKKVKNSLLLVVRGTTGNVVQLMQQAAVRNHPVKTATWS